MTTSDQLDGPAVLAFSDRLRGELLEPDDDGYDEARTIWNGMIDREPAAIARCVGAADVITAVDFARENDIRLSIKSGGHHVSGAAVCDGGLMIDVSQMNSVRVDPDAKTARVQAGATWGDIDHETQQFGLAVPGGQDPNIGVAGLTLGGGFGWLSRKYGLTCDNLLAADVVTADGELVHASEDENADLFWALRGGGGNFGIVTSFKFQLHDVGPEILGGSLIYSLEEADAVARRCRDFMVEAPEEVGVLFGIMELPAASYYPEEIHNTRVVLLVTFYGGDPEEGKKVLAPLREFGDPVMDSIRRRQYKSFQRAGESADVARTYLRSQFFDSFSDSVIETIVEHSKNPPSAGCTVFAASHDGAVTNRATDATAYSHRDGSYHLLVEARWSKPNRDKEHMDWVQSFYEDVRPYTTGDVSMNFLTNDESKKRVKAAFGENYERLVEVKNKWDPENRFQMNPNIEPIE